MLPECNFESLTKKQLDSLDVNCKILPSGCQKLHGEVGSQGLGDRISGI